MVRLSWAGGAGGGMSPGTRTGEGEEGEREENEGNMNDEWEIRAKKMAYHVHGARSDCRIG